MRPTFDDMVSIATVQNPRELLLDEGSLKKAEDSTVARHGNVYEGGETSAAVFLFGVAPQSITRSFTSR